MQNLKYDIKKNIYKNIYLFFGDEKYLIQYYEKKLRNEILPEDMSEMNYNVFKGKEIEIEKIIDAGNTLPFLSKNRLVTVKYSELFAKDKREDTNKLLVFLDEIPSSTVILFIEESVDKKNDLYKRIKKNGRVVEFKTPEENELLNWIIKYFEEHDKNISSSNAIFFLRTIESNMNNLITEMQKIISYKGDEKEITKQDILNICDISLDTKIFDLVKSIGNKNSKQSLEQYHNLLLMKQSPVMILNMIARQFRLILQCKKLSMQKYSTNAICEKLGLKFFVVKQCIQQSKNFNINTLKKALSDCLNTDFKIKSGQINDKVAVEILILKYSI